MNNGWQAGVCNSDGPPLCSVATPAQFFEEAAAHPQVGFTQFIVRNEPSVIPGPIGGPEEPVGALKTIRVDLPVGLSVNPQATFGVQCSQAQFDTDSCPAESKVGESFVTASLLGHPIDPIPGVTQAKVFNVVPPQGKPARFGLKLAGSPVYLEADVAFDSDYHEGFTIAVPELPIAGEAILKNRLVFNGRSGDGTFITTPSTCHDPATEPAWKHAYSTYLLASSVEEEAQSGYVFPESAKPALESPLPPGKKPLDCPGIPYDPSIDVGPGTTEADSPAGAVTEIDVPHITGGDERESSNTKQAQAVLPVGLGLNPSAANGLLACTDAQFGKGSKAPVACPPESKVGTVAIETPPLPEGSLKGDVFVGQQLSRDPASGDEYRIFVDAVSERYGLDIKLLGRVAADPTTGQLTARFSDTPQVPFSSFVIDLDDGPGAALTSPGYCGPHTSKAVMTPWSENPDAEPTSEFTLSQAAGGGDCPKSLAERPFVPTFAATTANNQAAGFNSIGIDLTRKDGEQELKGVEVTLPPGLTAKLAGVRYCPEETIAAAAANSGVAEKASPSCPAESLVGGASIVAGSGSQPLSIDGGKAFLAGPYNGAPLSLAVITPATAGPFDLGTVVVRVALFLDPKTAQVRTVTDAIPHVYGGTLLDLRSVSIDIDRPEFALNPTNCAAFAFAGNLRGGAGNPNDPAGFSTVPVSAPFQAVGCESLGFGPKLFLRAFGGTKRKAHPKVRAVLVARPGDANIARASVALPKGILLDQGAISQICTRVQFAAKKCPSNSVYGFAEAKSPLLDGPLKGNVYLRSSDNTLPDLVADLHGQVDIELAGRTDTTKNGRIRNTFDVVPDVPVSEFILTVRGGKKGLLINSRSLCKGKKKFARIELNAQNGKKVLKKKQRFKAGCKKKKKKKSGK
ncbi:MAG TPA: hypothetical protein VIT85_02705 [Solirubrobacterales bacterium]